MCEVEFQPKLQSDYELYIEWADMPTLGFPMMMSSNRNIFRFNGHLCGEFTGPRGIPAQRQVTRIFDVFLDPRPNKRLSKHW